MSTSLLLYEAKCIRHFVCICDNFVNIIARYMSLSHLMLHNYGIKFVYFLVVPFIRNNCFKNMLFYFTLPCFKQCDQIEQMFAFGYFLFEHFWHFYTNEQSQNIVCYTYFNIQWQLNLDVLYFTSYFQYFGCSFGHISKNWAIFFQSSSHPCFQLKFENDLKPSNQFILKI